MRKWLLLCACTLALTGRLSAQDQDGQGTTAPPPPDQMTSQPTPDQVQGQPQEPGTDQDASFQTFYDDLSSQGTWIQSSDYGYVWQPDVDDPDWAPYTNGNWVYSDDGWTWASNEPWGWATYHYGRWANLRGHGWCWVPGYTWAPAWVSWRYGNGYCGWAPLPPDSFYGIDYFDGDTDFSVGFHIGGDCDSYFGIGPGCYNFVPVSCLGYRNYHGYYAPRSDNFAIINHTTNVTNIVVSRNGERGGSAFGQVSVGGPSLDQVNALAKTPVATVNLVASNRRGGGVESNHALALYAPNVDPETRTTSRPGSVTGAIEHAEINRGTDVTQPLAVNSRLSPVPPTSEEVVQAREAQSNVPKGAKVMTAHTDFLPVFNGSLTSLRTLPGPGTGGSARASGVTSQAETAGQRGGPVVYPQGQVDEPPPSTVYTPPNHVVTSSGSDDHSTQSSTQQGSYAPSHEPSSNEDSSQSRGYSNSGDESASRGYYSPSSSGSGYHSTQPTYTTSHDSSSNEGSSQSRGYSNGGGGYSNAGSGASGGYSHGGGSGGNSGGGGYGGNGSQHQH